MYVFWANKLCENDGHLFRIMIFLRDSGRRICKTVNDLCDDIDVQFVECQELNLFKHLPELSVYAER